MLKINGEFLGFSTIFRTIEQIYLMQDSANDGRIIPSKLPDRLRGGYSEFQERFAAGMDTRKSLTQLQSLEEALDYGWFAVGYFEGLLDDDRKAQPRPVSATAPSSRELQTFLAWLKPVHDGACDGGPPDTTFVANNFEGLMRKTESGVMFANRDLWTPDWAIVDAQRVRTTSNSSKLRIRDAAYNLGLAHRP